MAPNLVGTCFEALTARAAQALAADLHRILADLHPAWNADAVHDAARTGITSATTADQVIAMGDEAVAAWRTLAAPLAPAGSLERAKRIMPCWSEPRGPHS